MNRSSLGVRTTNTTSGQGCFEIRTPATTRCKLMELSICQSAATAQSLGIGRPAAIGASPSVQSLFQRDDPGDPASLISGATAWATAPTPPTIFHERFNFPANIGAAIIWTFPDGIIIPISSGFSVHNITVGVASDVNAIVLE